MKHLFALVLLVSSFFATAQIDYVLKMSQPQTHYFEVQMNIKNIKGKEIEVKMPVWAPGSYLVRDFSKNVNQVRAYDEAGNQLEVYKSRKNGWKIVNGKARNVRVEYEVYAFELTVRTSFLDLTHGFVSGTGMFMYAEQFRNQGGKLTVYPHSSFAKVTTALKKQGEGVVQDGRFDFIYTDYDELADCPLEIGNHQVFEFTASGCKHEVAVYGDGNYQIDKLKRDMAKIVDASTSIYGEMPNDHYVFIIHNVANSQGGLEHVNSTTLSVNRFIYSPETYNRFLTLVAHEYFHLWNVKRLRAKELGPFNYDEEVYTPLLYVMEGFTSYYEDLIVYKAGFLSEEEYLGIVQAAANYVAGNIGSSVQSVADASFDAWIKAYKPNENSRNTTVSYYSGGGMIASVMDALVIAKFNGEKTLDDFLRILYKKYYKQKNVGFTNREFEQEFSDFMKEDMNWFFTDHVRGTKLPDYAKIFGAIGIEVKDVSTTKPDFGAYIGEDGIVKSIRSGSGAEKFGLSVNDEILAIDGYRVSKVKDKTDAFELGKKYKVLVSRDEVLMELQVEVENYTQKKYRFDFENEPSKLHLVRQFLRVN